MEYSHWDYNTDDEDDGNDIYTDDEEADVAAYDDIRDQRTGKLLSWKKPNIYFFLSPTSQAMVFAHVQ